MRLKMKFVAAMFAFTVVMAAHASTVLPDACGDDAVSFDVKTHKDHPGIGTPEEGKALIVFIAYKTVAMPVHFSPMRLGIDGSWVGAAKFGSYFTVSVTPGLHHLCASGEKNKYRVAVATVTAEAGKVYFYEWDLGANAATTLANEQGISGGIRVSPFSSISADDGNYHVKIQELATSTAKQ